MTMSSRSPVKLWPLLPGSTDIPEAADCTSRAFSDDPLIIWLQKPREPRWGALTPPHRRFQQTRLSRDAASSKIICASLSGSKTERDVSGICVLHSPERPFSWLQLTAWSGWLTAKWTEWWDPLTAKDVEKSRLDELIMVHEEQFKRHTQRLPKQSVWYLEVVATNPSAQGAGVGGALMRWVLEQIGHESCFLECTDEKNVPFYEKYGFRLMETSILSRDIDGLAVKVFWMLRSENSP